MKKYTKKDFDRILEIKLFWVLVIPIVFLISAIGMLWLIVMFIKIIGWWGLMALVGLIITWSLYITFKDLTS